MKIHRLVVYIIDHDVLGPVHASDALEGGRFANRCIDPRVHSVETYDIGEWADDHPLNFYSTDVAEYLGDATADEVHVRQGRVLVRRS